MRSLADVIAFNEGSRSREMPFFGQELLRARAEEGTADRRRTATRWHGIVRLSRTQGIDAVMDKYRLDALIAPTGNPAWTTDLVNGDHFVGSSSTPAAVAGYPSMTVPAGSAFGLPVGISFIGGAWRRRYWC